MVLASQFGRVNMLTDRCDKRRALCVMRMDCCASTRTDQCVRRVELQHPLHHRHVRRRHISWLQCVIEKVEGATVATKMVVKYNPDDEDFFVCAFAASIAGMAGPSAAAD